MVCCGFGHAALSCSSRKRILEVLQSCQDADFKSTLLTCILLKLNDSVKTSSTSAPLIPDADFKTSSTLENTTDISAPKHFANLSFQPSVSKQVCTSFNFGELHNTSNSEFNPPCHVVVNAVGSVTTENRSIMHAGNFYVKDKLDGFNDHVGSAILPSPTSQAQTTTSPSIIHSEGKPTEGRSSIVAHILASNRVHTITSKQVPLLNPVLTYNAHCIMSNSDTIYTSGSPAIGVLSHSNPTTATTDLNTKDFSYFKDSHGLASNRMKIIASEQVFFSPQNAQLPASLSCMLLIDYLVVLRRLLEHLFRILIVQRRTTTVHLWREFLINFRL